MYAFVITYDICRHGRWRRHRVYSQQSALALDAPLKCVACAWLGCLGLAKVEDVPLWLLPTCAASPTFAASFQPVTKCTQPTSMIFTVRCVQPPGPCACTACRLLLSTIAGKAELGTRASSTASSSMDTLVAAALGEIQGR